MREIGALFRAAWLTESSYRMSMAFSLLSLLVMVGPLYFVANALQPTMAVTIASQSQQYFAFLLIGATIYTFVAACTSALPNALASAIGRGTLEAFLGTPTNIAILFVGMSAYGIAWALLRAGVLVVAGVALGVRIHWSALPNVGLILLLLVLAYGSIGLIGAAFLLRFRTTGPLLSGVLTGSALLGGVYYPTHVIPSWLQDLSRVLPLSYGLKAVRQASLLGESFSIIGHDVIVLALCVVVLLPVGVLAVAFALHYARRTGTLSHY